MDLRGVGEGIGPTVYMVYSISVLVYNRLEGKETDLPSFRQQLVNRELVSHQRYARSWKKVNKKGFEPKKKDLRRISYSR